MTISLMKTLSACLTELLFQLDAADEKLVNSDFSVTLMEIVGAELQELEGPALAEFIAAVREVATAETDERRRLFLENFPNNFGLIVDRA